MRDVTLFATACMVGTRWIASAAHAGSGAIVLWLLGAVLFVAPLAVAVGALTVKRPSAGGLYVWTREDFGPWHGFLCFWAYWIQIALWFPSAAMFYLGSVWPGLADNRAYLVCASLAAIWIALGTNIVGMKVGKWTENLGGAASWALAALLTGAAVAVWFKRGPAAPLTATTAWDWSTLNLLGVIAFAMSGLELIGLMGAEIRDPAKTVPRAGWIASGFVTVFYVATTLSLLVLLRPGEIGELRGLAQGGEVAGRVLGLPWMAGAIAALVLLSSLGQFGGLGTGVSRMPYAAGVDRLLPAAFGKLHRSWGTPYISMLCLGGVSSALLIVSQLGDTLNAGYRSLVSLMVITGFFPYVYLFGSAWKIGKTWSAAAGWTVTAIAMVCSAVPDGEIHDVWAFELKLAVGTLGTVGSAWFFYTRSSRNAVAM